MVDAIEDTDGEETEEGNHSEEKHLGASNLPIYIGMIILVMCMSLLLITGKRI